MSGEIIHGIPTAHAFRRQIGRSGIRQRFKKPDPRIDEILVALETVQYWRAIMDLPAISHLRKLRSACADWIAANAGADKPRASRPHITELGRMSHVRITTVAEYILGKSAAEHERRRIREAMTSVHDEIRLRRGATAGVGRPLDRGYAIERASGTHMPNTPGQQAKRAYENARTADVTRLGFEDWVEYVYLPLSQDDPFDQLGFGVASSLIRDLLARGQSVKYCTPEEREAYRLQIVGGRISDVRGDAYHTGMKETHFSGSGWAIYVVDFDNTFYSESHVVSAFHHSSFLAGAPVKAAGELAVDRGRLVALTNKTGHYKAGEAELAMTLRLLRMRGVDLDDVAVNDPFKAPGKWVSGSHALSANGKLADVDQVVPGPRRVTG